MDFGEKIKSLREAKGMTQQKLADQLFVTRQTVSKWEVGSRYPDLLTTKSLADILGASIDDLVSDEETYVNKRQALLANVKRDMIAATFYPVILLFCIIPLLLLLDDDPYYWFTHIVDKNAYLDIQDLGWWSLVYFGYILFFAAIAVLAVAGLFAIWRKELSIKNVTIMGIITYAYTGMNALYTILAPFTLDYYAQQHVAEGIILYVVTGCLVLACICGVYATYKQFIAVEKQSSSKTVFFNVFVYVLMLLNYTMFINTHYTADVDLFLHHGSVISVLMLLSVITVISNRYKTAKVQKEEIPVEVTAVDSNA
jgi:transcriptional regulator with XRE-family HTH domain